MLDVKIDLDLLNDAFNERLTVDDFEVTMKIIAPNTIIIKPDDIITCEVRSDHSRLFIEIEDNVVVTGYFQ